TGAEPCRRGQSGRFRPGPGRGRAAAVLAAVWTVDLARKSSCSAGPGLAARPPSGWLRTALRRPDGSYRSRLAPRGPAGPARARPAGGAIAHRGPAAPRGGAARGGRAALRGGAVRARGVPAPAAAPPGGCAAPRG